jgi:hypothetical protein
MIVDEAMFYTPLQHEALLPALSARPNPQIIYTSSAADRRRQRRDSVRAA